VAEKWSGEAQRDGAQSRRPKSPRAAQIGGEYMGAGGSGYTGAPTARASSGSETGPGMSSSADGT
jgi:hypothetical protein